MENGRDDESLERPNPRDRGDRCDSERLIAGSVNLSCELAEGDSTSQLLGTWRPSRTLDRTSSGLKFAGVSWAFSSSTRAFRLLGRLLRMRVENL